MPSRSFFVAVVLKKVNRNQGKRMDCWMQHLFDADHLEEHYDPNEIDEHAYHDNTHKSNSLVSNERTHESRHHSHKQ